MKTLLTSVAAASLLCLAMPAFAADAAYSSAYGDYLVGRIAAAQGDTETAARALMAASDADPGNGPLRERAFLAAVLSGDMSFAQSHLPDGGGRLSRMVAAQIRTLSLIRDGKARDAITIIEASEKAGATDRATVLLKPLSYAAARQWDKAIDPALEAQLTAESTPNKDRLVLFLQAANQARLLELKGRNSEAEAIFKIICQPGPASVLFGPYYGAFLEQRGRKDEARKLYTDILAVSEDRLVRQRIEALDAKGYRKPKKPDVRLIMADSLFLSGTLYASEQQAEMALATLRLAQYAAPETPAAAPTVDRTRLLAGQVLMRMKDVQAAQTEWASIEPSSPFYREAQVRAAWSLKEAGDLDGAEALFTELSAADPKDIGLTVERARLLWQKDDTAGAIKLMEAYTAAYGDADFGWETWFTAAVLYQAAGDWDKAKVAAQRGLALEPDSSELLNLLGYGMIDRNENVAEGMAMIRKALDKAPRSGAIMDSLGWGHYKQGQYAEALEWIEKAIAVEPADPEITDHLGDVYQKLGRTVEAKYQWARVLTLEADDKQKAAVQAKLDAAEARESKAVAEAEAKQAKTQK